MSATDQQWSIRFSRYSNSKYIFTLVGKTSKRTVEGEKILTLRQPRPHVSATGPSMPYVTLWNHQNTPNIMARQEPKTTDFVISWNRLRSDKTRWSRMWPPIKTANHRVGSYKFIHRQTQKSTRKLITDIVMNVGDLGTLMYGQRYSGKYCKLQKTTYSSHSQERNCGV